MRHSGISSGGSTATVAAIAGGCCNSSSGCRSAVVNHPGCLPEIWQMVASAAAFVMATQPSISAGNGSKRCGSLLSAQCQGPKQRLRHTLCVEQQHCSHNKEHLWICFLLLLAAAASSEHKNCSRHQRQHQHSQKHIGRP